MKPNQPSDEVVKQILKLIRPEAEQIAKEKEKEGKEKGHAD